MPRIDLMIEVCHPMPLPLRGGDIQSFHTKGKPSKPACVFSEEIRLVSIYENRDTPSSGKSRWGESGVEKGERGVGII